MSLKLDIDVKALEALLEEFEGSSREREALLLLNRGVETEEMRPYIAQLATILEHLFAKFYCPTTFTSTMVRCINIIVKQLNWSANSGDCNEEKPKEVVPKGQTKNKQSQALRQPRTKRDKQNEEVQFVSRVSGGGGDSNPGKPPKAGSNGMEEESNLEVECVGELLSSDVLRKIEAHARCSEWSECNIEARAMEPAKEQGRRLSVMGLETVKVEYAEGETSQHIGFNCSYCDGYFNNPSQLDAHERYRHACAVLHRELVQTRHWVKRFKAPTKYFCKWCEKEDLTEEQFQKHENFHFRESLPFTVTYHEIGGQRDIPKYCQ